MLYVMFALLFTLRCLEADGSYESARASLNWKLERIEFLEQKVAVLKIVNAKKPRVLELLKSVRSHRTNLSNSNNTLNGKAATQKGKPSPLRKKNEQK